MSWPVAAVRMHADWRPLVGLTPADAGTLVEVVLARRVIGEALRQHNDDARRT